jgi:hypothetical protein
MSENDLAYEASTATPAPLPAPQRRRGWRLVGVVAAVLMACLVLAAWGMAQGGYIVIDGEPASGLAAISGGFLGVVAVAMVLLLAMVVVVLAMVSVSVMLSLMLGLVVLVVALALAPVWLPLLIAGGFLVWLFRR